MTFYEKLKTIIEKGGLYVVVQDEDRDYCIFSVVTSDGNIRSSDWHDIMEKCKDTIGEDSCYSEEMIERDSKTENWEIVKTIVRESNYKVGDKVKVRETGKIDEISNVKERYNCKGVWNIELKNHPHEEFYIPEIEPYFEEEEMVTIKISKKSLEGIKDYKLIK